MLNKKRSFGLVALILIVILAAAVFPACKLEGGDQSSVATDPPVPTIDPADLAGTKVVMSSKHFDITLYDFGQAYYNSQYFQYLMYGLFTPDQYCDAVIGELTNYLYILNAAADDGVELTDEEKAEIDSTISEQLEMLLLRYEENLPEGTADKRAEAKANLEKDLAEDGIDYDSFLELAKNNMIMSKLANKYYEKIKDSIEISDEEIEKYVQDHRISDSGLTVSEFVEKISNYN